ncbi:MAG: hypothetical protein U0J30_03990 [Megasphaera sp.]|nr:hypothetical protein [Megasphaera sp.]
MGHGILIAGDDVNPIRSVDVGYVGMGEDFTGILKSLVGGQFPETGKAAVHETKRVSVFDQDNIVSKHIPP